MTTDAREAQRTQIERTLQLAKLSRTELAVQWHIVKRSAAWPPTLPSRVWPKNEIIIDIIQTEFPV